MVLSEVAKYYFDGHGKALRPVLTSAMASAVNQHLHRDPNDEVCMYCTRIVEYCMYICSCSSTIYDFHKLQQVLASLQSRVVLAAEMYHTASLMHDDVSLVRFVRKPSKRPTLLQVIDHADTRRGKESMNRR